MELASLIGDVLEDFLYMITTSIINGFIVLGIFYFITILLPEIIARRPRFYRLAMQRVGPTPSDTFRTAHYLKQLIIPSDLVPIIMDMAGFWIDAPLASKTGQLKVDQKTAGSKYLEVDLPDTFPGRCLRTLTFTATSKDQGDSWDTDFHSSYLNSWTWFEVAIFSPESEHPAGLKHTVIPPPEPGQVTQMERSRSLLASKKIITNVHAGKEYKTHTVRWSYDDDNKEIRKLMRSIRGGMRIAITVWARYPAWVNDVRSARIDCQVNGVRRL